ncbi:nucleotidyl transferase AbiEii/AbiGii toxin family protein [Candidatus Micrarchaeota archaeon]|nr:nucleotidyl transferase AbiEii/AbiGii toxin family protein [Candidatus Micrarchaeota archaeon]
MEEQFNRKYKKVLEILPDVAECAKGRLVLAGGTALALFYLKHRVSVDLDFVLDRGDEIKMKEELKGCLTKKGYRTIAGAFSNQFVVQFEDTSIKVEVFKPDCKIRKVEEHVFGGARIRIASLEDIFRMKIAAYRERKEARDLFDVFCILKSKGSGFIEIERLLSTAGKPRNIEDIEAMAVNRQDAVLFHEVVFDASP